MRTAAGSHGNRGVIPDVREIPKWARRYAQTRAMPVVIGLAFFALFFGGFSLAGLLARQAWATGRTLPVVLAAGGMLMLVTALVAFCTRGHRLVEAIAQRYYQGEGSVSVGMEAACGPRWLGGLVGALFAACVVGSIALGMVGWIPPQLMQPVSALYCVPFIVFLALRQRQRTGLLPLLWPALYLVHALLVVSGALPNAGSWPQAHMFIATLGYGLLSALAGHACNRLALHRLRRLAGNEETVERNDDSE